jgi:peptidoglycan glycosyltransferase
MAQTPGNSADYLRAVRPLVACVTIAAALVMGISLADDQASAARAAQDTGRTRGSIVDRNGVPLAWTQVVSGTPVFKERESDLSTALGFRDPYGRWHGLESSYDGILTAAHARHDWRTFFLNLRGAPAAGDIVRTTLDARLQHVAASALGSHRGAVVAIQPQTGEVLSFVSSPSCSAAQLAVPAGYKACAGNGHRPLLRRATELLLPPGSSFKIVTLSTAIDTGAFDLDSVFSGADAFGPSPYFDNSTYPSNVTRSDLTQLTLAQALAFSDNFTFAHIGLTVGASKLLRYAHRFYVGRRIPFAYPVARSRIADDNPSPSSAQVARSAFGAPDDLVTPLQMALIASAVANKGTLMAPHLVADTEDASGQVQSTFMDHSLGRVMSRKSAEQVTKGMEFVVQHGSGFKAQIHGIGVAGKTGTAASGADLPHAWFICFAPASHPVVAVAVLREFSGEGFKYAAPVARKVMVAALQQKGFRVH